MHPEFDPNLMDLSNEDIKAIISDLQKDDEIRFQLFRSILRRLGLKTSETALSEPKLSNLAIVSSHHSMFSQLWQKINKENSDSFATKTSNGGKTKQNKTKQNNS